MYSYRIIDAEKVVELREQIDSQPLLDDRRLSKSAMRALDVLEFFAGKCRPARATEVAQALGLSTSTADQLLKTLVSRAYLIFDRQRKHYYPSPRLLGFSALLERMYFGGDRLQRLMRDLVDRTGLAVSICTPFGRLMQLVDCRLPTGQAYGRPPGHLFPIFSSAAGAAILATWPLVTVRRLIEQSEDQLGTLAATPDVICDRLKEVRENGHAFGGLSEDTHNCSLSVALPATGSGTELTLSLRGPTKQLQPNRWRLAAMIEEQTALHLR